MGTLFKKPKEDKKESEVKKTLKAKTEEKKVTKPEVSEAKGEATMEPEVETRTKSEDSTDIKSGTEAKPEAKERTAVKPETLEAKSKTEEQVAVKSGTSEAKPETKERTAVKPETLEAKSKTEEQVAVKSGTSEAKPETKERTAKQTEPQATLKLEGLFAFKMSMTTFYTEKGESVPVTALKYEPCRVSQIKTPQKDSYHAVQLAFRSQKNKRCSKALVGHLKPAGFKEGARFVREIRQEIPKETKPGEVVSIESLKKGDRIKISSISKGRGFSGVMKRWNFAGGKASHGSKSHRRTGSIGQHTEPARVMPGRKMPGQYGFKQVSRLNVPVVEVFSGGENHFC